MNYATTPSRAISRGFVFAGAVNVIGMLMVSKGFTNGLLSATDPAVFSWLGQVSVVLWGLAYWAVAQSYRHVPYLVLVFCIEKMVYTASWLVWLMDKSHSLAAVASQSTETAIFFGMYGAGDFAFGLFFGWVAFQVLRGRNIGAT